jgi:hypothetical protein
MKNVTVLLLLVSLFGCKTYSYFSTSNDMLKQDCTVYLLNGTMQRGKLTILLETGHTADNIIHLLTGKKEEKKIVIDSIKYYKCNNDYYYPKKLNLEAYEIPNRYYLSLPNVSNILFLKALTKENSRIMLYELYEPAAKSNDGTDHYDHFISFQNDSRLDVWNLGNSRFFPRFEDKVSSIVADCPVLSDKIKQRTKGYFASQVSVDAKKYEVFERIATEYNACN